MKRHFGLLLVVVLFLSIFSLIPQVVARDVSATPWPTNGWQTSTPEEQGVDSEALTTLLQSNMDVHTILAIRHGTVILDASPYPFTSSQPHALFSVTKSFVSTLVGIAIDKGYIKSVKQSIWDFFPKEKTANMDSRKEAITIEHLLTHTSGLGITDVDEMNIFKSTDVNLSWVQFILDKPMQSEPGKDWLYRNTTIHLVSAIVQIATKMSTSAFAEQFLFAPLGITDATWLTDPQGVNHGAKDLYVSPASMAKLGYLYLHHGEWDGQHIVSADWVTRATSNLLQGWYWEGYGYLWYDGLVNGTKHRGYSAIGYLGQAIWVIPDLDLVVVTTNDPNYYDQTIVTSIVNASTSDQTLQANPAATEALQARIDVLAHPQATPVKPLPDIMKTVSGKRYQFEANDLGWNSISIEFAKTDEALITLGLQDKELKLPVGLDNVYRVSADGLPSERGDRPIANVPQMLKGGILGKTFIVYMGDRMGMEFWTITMKFSTDGRQVQLSAQSFGDDYGGVPKPFHHLVGSS